MWGTTFYMPKTCLSLSHFTFLSFISSSSIECFLTLVYPYKFSYSWLTNRPAFFLFDRFCFPCCSLTQSDCCAPFPHTAIRPSLSTSLSHCYSVFCFKYFLSTFIHRVLTSYTLSSSFPYPILLTLFMIWILDLLIQTLLFAWYRLETILHKLEVLDHKARERAGVITPTLNSPIPVLLSFDASVEVKISLLNLFLLLVLLLTFCCFVI